MPKSSWFCCCCCDSEIIFLTIVLSIVFYYIFLKTCFFLYTVVQHTIFINNFYLSNIRREFPHEGQIKAFWFDSILCSVVPKSSRYTVPKSSCSVVPKSSRYIVPNSSCPTVCKSSSTQVQRSNKLDSLIMFLMNGNVTTQITNHKEFRKHIICYTNQHMIKINRRGNFKTQWYWPRRTGM